MDAGGAGLVGAAVADDGMADDQRGFGGFRFGLGDSGGYGVQVQAVHTAQDLPAVGFEAAGYIFQKGYIGVALDGNFVVIIDQD